MVIESINIAEVLEPQRDIDNQTIINILQHGEIKLIGLMPWGSNHTFLVQVLYQDVTLNAIYKPSVGEHPLWDFTHGTLCRREVAAYQVSCALETWVAVPYTILRDGPHGIGCLQQFIYADYHIHYFTLKDNPQLQTKFQQIVLFDYLINNADRKGGHCLLDAHQKLWAIDHGLSFHTDYKLKTVIWEYANTKITETLYADLQNFKKCLKSDSKLYQNLSELLSSTEIAKIGHRLNILLNTGKFPKISGKYDYPYPPI